MVKRYRIYIVREKTVCAPDDGFFAKSGSWTNSYVETLDFIDEFNTEVEAIGYGIKNYGDGFMIIPFYSIN